jgi:hypothetical protein
MPYTSYFSDAQSVPPKWGLADNQAKTVCEIWENVCNELNTTYKNSLTDDVEGYFKQKEPQYDTPHTKSSYKSWDRVIFEDQFKKLVDIQRALLVLRASTQPPKRPRHR